MNLEQFREYCIQKLHVTEHFPFDNETLVFKVSGKIFALVNINSFQFVNLKCDPERSLELREQYDAIRTAYHMNKKHWNSVSVYSDVEQKMLLELVDHSYNLVFQSLPKKRRDELALG
jgi:predicted DNA-binding protein (MmcQ/YjbR family)